MTLSSLTTVREQQAPAERQNGVNILAAFFAAIQFLTVIPPVVRRPFSPTEIGWSVAFFPLVGGLVGGVLIGVDRVAGLMFPPSVCAAVILFVWVLLTGALHFDGFLDTCDGLFGGHTAEARLRIMRDERVGAYAVTGGILLILVKFSALTALANRETALLLAPVLGRWAIVSAVIGFPYARVQGLGREMKDHAGWLQGFLATLVVVPVAVWVDGWLGLAALGIVWTGVLAGAWFVLRRLSGLTGDVYGCFCEVSETLVLLTLVAGDQA
jgi:adenosylcobinamide-GDP ribazoletransferase